MAHCKLALVLHRVIECNQLKQVKILYAIVLYVINNVAYILLSSLLIIGYCEHRMIWIKAAKKIIRLIVFLMLPCTFVQAEPLSGDAWTSSTVTVNHGEQSTVHQEKETKPRLPRLKYRNGPVCMCNDGLSEAEIQAAWIKRFSQPKDSE